MRPTAGQSHDPASLERTDKLRALFVQFASGFETFEERRAFFTQEPVLLSDEAFVEIEKMITEQKPQGFTSVLTRFRLYRNLLQACRKGELDDAFKSFSAPSEAAMNVVMAIHRAGSIPHVLQLVGEHQALLKESQ